MRPAAWLNLFLVNSPKRELLFESRPADVGRRVELPRPIIVQHRFEHGRMTVEKKLARDRIVIRRRARGRDRRHPCEAGIGDIA